MTTNFEPDTVGVEVLNEYAKASTADFKLEVEALNALKSAGFICHHGGYYKDPVSGANREFDIRAEKNVAELDILKLTVECKNVGRNAPVLVETLPRTCEELEYICMLDTGLFAESGRSPREVAGRVVMDKCHSIGTGMYVVGAPVVKSIQQVGIKNNNAPTRISGEIYGKWSQALASMHELVLESFNAYCRYQSFTKMKFHHLPFVVVPDGTLFSVDYDSDGNLKNEAHSVDFRSAYVNHEIYLGFDDPIYNHRIPNLHFVTLSRFKRICAGISEMHAWSNAGESVGREKMRWKDNLLFEGF